MAVSVNSMIVNCSRVLVFRASKDSVIESWISHFARLCDYVGRNAVSIGEGGCAPFNIALQHPESMTCRSAEVYVSLTN